MGSRRLAAPAVVVANGPHTERHARAERVARSGTLENGGQPAAKPAADRAAHPSCGGLAGAARWAVFVDRHGVSGAVLSDVRAMGTDASPTACAVSGSRIISERSATTLCRASTRCSFTARFSRISRLSWRTPSDAPSYVYTRGGTYSNGKLRPMRRTACKGSGRWFCGECGWRRSRRWLSRSSSSHCGHRMRCGRCRSSSCGRSRHTSPIATGLPKQGDRHVLDARERRELRQTARLTWRFFEEMVSKGDNWLVPDNYQENRPDPIAHRTSPTNIGLQMLAAVSAWDLGYLSAGECLTHLDHIVDTLQKLPRYRGHLFNWYDTRSLVPLAPLYVSTVDSGNLLGYLMTISGALPSIADAELSIDRRFRDGLSDTLNLFERDARPVIAALGRESARDFRADLRRIRAALDATPIGIAGTSEWLRSVSSEISVLTARLHDAQHRLPLGDAKVASANWWLDSAGRDDQATAPRSCRNPAVGRRDAARHAAHGGSSSRRHRRVHRQHRARLPVRSRTAPLRDRLQRHRGPAGRDLLRRIGLRSASRELRRHRDAPRVAGALVQAGPTDDAGGTASRARVVERVDVRVPDAASRHAQLSAHASSRDV